MSHEIKDWSEIEREYKMVEEKIKSILPENIDIDFFKADSNNCWNKSESTVCLEPEEV